MNISQIIINRISNNDGKLLFEYPTNTLLDKIIIDLWPTIVKYHDVCLFAFGDYGDDYPGYRAITNKEFSNNNFIEEFSQCYIQNNGLISLDNCLGNMLCCNDKSMMKIYGDPIVLNGCSLEKRVNTFWIAKGYYSTSDYDLKKITPNKIRYIYTYGPAQLPDNELLCLFVPIHYRFKN